MRKTGLGRFESGFTRSLARLLAAPCAYRDGWGEPAGWVRYYHGVAVISHCSGAGSRA